MYEIQINGGKSPSGTDNLCSLQVITASIPPCWCRHNMPDAFLSGIFSQDPVFIKGHQDCLKRSKSDLLGRNDLPDLLQHGHADGPIMAEQSLQLLGTVFDANILERVIRPNYDQQQKPHRLIVTWFSHDRHF